MGIYSSLGVTSAVARDLFAHLNMGLAEKQAAYASIYPTVCSVFDSNTATERYNFSKCLASVREFQGERIYEKVKTFPYELTNRSWEVSMEWSVDEIEDDQSGTIKMAIDEHIIAAVEDPDTQLATLISNHVAGTLTRYPAGFDGVSTFSASHTWGTNVPYTTNQSNLLSGGNAGKLDLTYGHANMQTAYNRLSQGFFGPDGRRIRQRPSHLLCSFSVYWDALRLFDSAGIQSGSTATYGLPDKNVTTKMGLDIIPVHGMTDGYWVMACLDTGVRPFIFQNRKALEADMDDQLLFDKRIWRAGTFARYELGSGFWFRAIAGDGT